MSEVTAEQLIEVLKFTPRTYKITLWGYGGERVMGVVDRKIYDYFKSRRLDVSDYCWDSDYADLHKIPEDMQPFDAGSWYDCDSIVHTSGVSMESGTIQIEDENSNTVFEKPLEECDGCDGSPELECFDEHWVDKKEPGTVVFIGNSNEKGTFFEGEINLTAPFDITKLKLIYEEIDGEGIVDTITYDDEEIDNWGGNTDGKSSDFGFYIAGSRKENGRYECYRNMDDIEYPMTEWFPSKIKPVHEGMYMVKTAGKNSYTYQCKWNGHYWKTEYSDDEVKIKEWQGLAVDPDAVTLDFSIIDLESELQELKREFEQLTEQEK
jgi:hypothetical protein